MPATSQALAKLLAAREYHTLKKSEKGKEPGTIRSSRLYKSSASGWSSGYTTHE
jgi:hypothetical protein